MKRFSEGTRKISFVSQSRSKECSLKGHTNSVTKNRERHDISRVAVSVMSSSRYFCRGRNWMRCLFLLFDNLTMNLWVCASIVSSSCQLTQPPSTASSEDRSTLRLRKDVSENGGPMHDTIARNGCPNNCCITFAVASDNANVVWR